MTPLGHFVMWLVHYIVMPSSERNSLVTIDTSKVPHQYEAMLQMGEALPGVTPTVLTPEMTQGDWCFHHDRMGTFTATSPTFHERWHTVHDNDDRPQLGTFSMDPQPWKDFSCTPPYRIPYCYKRWRGSEDWPCIMLGSSCPPPTTERGLQHYVVHLDGTVDIPITKDHSWIPIYELTEAADLTALELAKENYNRNYYMIPSLDMIICTTQKLMNPNGLKRKQFLKMRRTSCANSSA